MIVFKGVKVEFGEQLRVYIREVQLSRNATYCLVAALAFTAAVAVTMTIWTNL